MSEHDIQELRHFLNLDTTGGRPAIDPLPWRMWGGELRSTSPDYGPDDADYDHSRIVATFYSRPNEHGGSHVANLYFVQAAVSALGPLLDEFAAKDAALATAQQQVRDLRAALVGLCENMQEHDGEMGYCNAGCVGNELDVRCNEPGAVYHAEDCPIVVARAALTATAEPEAGR